MKKLLFMVTSMNVGGVEKSLISLISTIPKSKYSVTILMLEKKGGFLHEIPSWVNVEVADWYLKIKPIIMQPPQKTIKELFCHRKILKAVKFLIVYLISKYFNDRYLYYKYVMKDVPKNLNKYDLAISYQGPTNLIDYYVGNKVTAHKKVSWVHFDVSQHYINTKLYDKLYKSYSEIFVVSNEAKMQLIKNIPSITNKAKVVKNVVSKESILKMSRQQIRFDPYYKGLKIVTVGRLSWEKGQDLAIHVLYKLRQKGYDVRWYCIGEGRQKDEYKSIVEKLNLTNYFLFLGEKSNPYTYIYHSDIYVQPSRHEGYCLTLAEAKCLYKPIVTTNFTGANEQIINNKTGIIVDIDVNDIYLAIIELINHPKLSQQLSSNLAKENLKMTEFDQISI